MPFSELDTRTKPEGKYMLLAPMGYTHPDNGATIWVPKGFVSDFASIPNSFRWILTGHNHTRKPAVLHDWLYRTGYGTRKGADLLFLSGMREQGLDAVRRRLAYYAVRVGGWRTWNKYRKQKKAP